MVRTERGESLINVTKLKQQLKQNDLKNIYLFVGEEKYLVDMYLKKITDLALGDGLREFNYSHYNEDNEDYESFVNDIEAYPTMAGKKVVVLKNTKFIKLKDYQKPLCELLGNLPDYAVVIIVEEEASKIKKALTDVINKKGEIVEFKKQSVADLRAWVTRQLSQKNKQMNNDDMEYLVNLCERSLEKLSVECEKLMSATEGNFITRAIIDELVKVPVEYKIFEMSDHLLSGNAEKAYAILNGFKISKEQPIVIFITIYKQLADIYMFRVLGEEGKNAAEYLAPNRKWLASKLSAEARRHSKEKIRMGMRLCAEFDLQIKSGKIDGFTALEIMMAEFLK